MIFHHAVIIGHYSFHYDVNDVVVVNDNFG